MRRGFVWWSVEDVSAKLREWGLGVYVDIFAEKSIDGEMLVELTDSEMAELIAEPFHRRKVKIKVAKLRQMSSS